MQVIYTTVPALSSDAPSIPADCLLRLVIIYAVSLLSSLLADGDSSSCLMQPTSTPTNNNNTSLLLLPVLGVKKRRQHASRVVFMLIIRTINHSCSSCLPFPSLLPTTSTDISFSAVRSTHPLVVPALSFVFVRYSIVIAIALLFVTDGWRWRATQRVKVMLLVLSVVPFRGWRRSEKERKLISHRTVTIPSCPTPSSVGPSSKTMPHRRQWLARR